jgi:hypothetical protein
VLHPTYITNTLKKGKFIKEAGNKSKDSICKITTPSPYHRFNCDEQGILQNMQILQKMSGLKEVLKISFLASLPKTLSLKKVTQKYL